MILSWVSSKTTLFFSIMLLRTKYRWIMLKRPVPHPVKSECHLMRTGATTNMIEKPMAERAVSHFAK